MPISRQERDGVLILTPETPLPSMPSDVESLQVELQSVAEAAHQPILLDLSDLETITATQIGMLLRAFASTEKWACLTRPKLDILAVIGRSRNLRTYRQEADALRALHNLDDPSVE